MTIRKYDHVTRYYLLGTGNSYRAAPWFAKASDEETVAETIPICIGRIEAFCASFLHS